MPAPDIYLTKPQVMLTQSSSELNIKPNDGSLMFGIIVGQYATSNYEMNGTPVLFNPKGALIINYGNVDYYIINEPQILFREAEYVPEP
jgi:hypothetical protein